METSYSFSTVRLADLESIVELSLADDQKHKTKFDEWFGFSYKFSSSEGAFLKRIIQKHHRRLTSYSEEKLKVKFIGAILNQVDFENEPIQDWYEPSFSGQVNQAQLKGFVDFMVATGTDVPKKPYFFIQEFKPSIPDQHPEPQLLAEMLVAIEKNQTTVFRGGYIIGQFWKFVMLEKIAENQFEYFVSEAFDSLKLPDLKKIYIILQAVKHRYCKD
jgi:hypothetical protein